MHIEYKVKCNCGEDLIITDATINHVKGEISFYVHDHECEPSFMKLFEEGKKVEVSVEKFSCPEGHPNARRRTMDIPVMEGNILIKAVKVTFCPTCGVNYLREEYLGELESLFLRSGIPTNKTFLIGLLRKGMESWHNGAFGKVRSEKKEEEQTK